MCDNRVSEISVSSSMLSPHDHYTFDFAEQLHLPNHVVMVLFCMYLSMRTRSFM